MKPRRGRAGGEPRSGSCRSARVCDPSPELVAYNASLHSLSSSRNKWSADDPGGRQQAHYEHIITPMNAGGRLRKHSEHSVPDEDLIAWWTRLSNARTGLALPFPVNKSYERDVCRSSALVQATGIPDAKMSYSANDFYDLLFDRFGLVLPALAYMPLCLGFGYIIIKMSSSLPSDHGAALGQRMLVESSERQFD
ncbi:hypothetical protein C8Q80DRAFT_1124081 [Daedaleopsis nitida]|nr:hypothetical protein C8Q80DRAFT_1124081 [Daedaleopsis nitida]